MHDINIWSESNVGEKICFETLSLLFPIGDVTKRRRQFVPGERSFVEERPLTECAATSW